jgi:hypothetical protein
MRKKIIYPNPIPGAPRGIRNNNPGNIVKTSIAWKGKIMPGTDPRFEQFERMEDGARAQLKNTHTWYYRGYDTLNELIRVWAPPSENDTEAYIKFVSQETGIEPDYRFNLTQENLIAIAYAMAMLENGRKWIKKEWYYTAIKML